MPTNNNSLDRDTALRAALGGARLAAEFLRGGVMPASVHLRYDTDSPCMSTTHDQQVFIHMDAVPRTGTGMRGRREAEAMFAFVAAHAVAGYVLDSTPPWVWERCASPPTPSRVATIASGFLLIDPAEEDGRTAAVACFLAGLSKLSAEEGFAALWRGAVGVASRALVREVRFSPRPGVVSGLGRRCDGLEDVVALVRWAGGQGAWPFSVPRRTRRRKAAS
jgi:hypothetical protein